MSLRRVLSVVPPLALAAAMLALGTAAAPGKARPGPGHRSLRLVAKPARMAPALLLAPGDRVERLIELRILGHGRFARVYFAARIRRSSRLDRDRARGLQVALKSCPRRWRRRGALYTCPGTSRVVLSRRPLAGRTRLKVRRFAAGRAVHLRLTVTLPRAATGALAGRRTRAVYSFVGVPAKKRR